MLEYLIKNGSEKVVDNAKEHMYDLKALLKFRFTDDKGKDQGINSECLNANATSSHLLKFKQEHKKSSNYLEMTQGLLKNVKKRKKIRENMLASLQIRIKVAPIQNHSRGTATKTFHVCVLFHESNQT